MADLHVHSRYSRATSPRMELHEMARSARRKGVGLLGTGDITHPGWRDLARSVLCPIDGTGTYECDGVLFILTGEISLVWKQSGRGRRIHLLLLLPSFRAADKVSSELEKLGTLSSDGRPILGVSAENTVAAILIGCPEAVVIPAHVWTPWYSVFGARSGFESLEECFGREAGAIHALETGLSSDPAMNRRWSALDSMRLVSFSDAHSPSKIGREVTVFDFSEITFGALAEALATGRGMGGTIEYLPQLGKYYYDGHRACDLSWSPQETRDHGGICPICGKPVTVGVLHRVDVLCDRQIPTGDESMTYIIPLDEILAWTYGIGTNTKRVRRTSEHLIAACGDELTVLLEADESALRDAADESVVRTILAARRGSISICPGYDGRYGLLEAESPSNGRETPVSLR